MTPVSLRFAPLPEHVRTARLVAVAVSRRSSAMEEDLDEVRLAVGEVCSRAVRRAMAALGRVETAGVVTVEMLEDGGLLTITVTDGADDVEIDDEDVALAILEGLTDSVEVSAGPGGPRGTVRITWDWRS